MSVVTLGTLVIIADALSPLIALALAFFLFMGVAVAVIVPFLFIVRVGIPRV
jgi:hypothetical protein